MMQYGTSLKSKEDVMEYDQETEGYSEDVFQQALLCLFHAAVDDFELDAEDLIEKARVRMFDNGAPRVVGHESFSEVCDALNELLGEDEDEM